MNDIAFRPLHPHGEAHMEAGAGEREPMRVLILEDVPTDAEITLRELRKVGIPFVSQRVDTRDKFEEALREFTPDLILSDFSLPASFDGLAALDIARQALPDVPYVFVSGTIGEDRAVEALKRGATDYVLKDRLNRLIPVIKRALGEKRDREARRRAEREIAEQREFYRKVIDLDRNFIFAKDREGRFTLVNQALAEAYGCSVEDLLGKTDADFNSNPEEVEHFRKIDLNVMDNLSETFIPEERITDASGRVRWLQTVKRPLVSADGKADMVLGVATDITERKNQEEKIARLSRIHAVLSGINGAIVRIRDRRELFEEACRIAVEHGNFGMAFIGKLDPGTLDVTPVAYAGIESGEIVGPTKTTARADVPLGQGVVGRAIRGKEIVFVNDLTAQPDLGSERRRAAIHRGYRSVAALPLLVEGAVFGTLALYAKEPNFFNEDELKLLRELAGDISFALENIAKEERLNYLAYYDGLTGLPNRTLFHERVVQLIQSIVPENQGVAMVVFDLERFRRINETLGMAAGDGILKQFAERLSAAAGEPATVARISADRFAAAMVPMRDATEIARVLEHRVFAAINEPFLAGEQTLHLPVKAGVAVYPGDGQDAAALYVNAEAALVRAKQSGDRFLFYAPQMNARVAERLTLENRLRTAILEEQFILHYQPKVDLATGEVSGLEALLRWVSPDLGLVSPAQFVPILEETGMILEVGRWALRKAISDHAAWRDRGLRPPRIAVNVSVIQLRQEQFVADVRNAVESGGASGKCIDLEITESMIMEDIAGSIRKLSEMKALGVGVSLDDFGTGYSSLSYIAKLPVNALKIDRSFVTAMADGAEHMAIVSAVISLARALNLKVVAEGVETPEQSNLLRLLRCNEAQGYLFYKPLPPEEIAVLLR